jgi:hypothetical protein
LANEKGEKKNTVKPQAAKATFAPDNAKKSVLLPKEEKKTKLAEEAPAAEAPAEPVAEVAAEAPAGVGPEAAALEASAGTPAEEASKEPKSE